MTSSGPTRTDVADPHSQPTGSFPLSEPATVTRPPKLARVMLPVLLVVSTCSLIASLALSPPKRQPQKPEPIDVAPIAVPDFAFTERNGQTVTNKDLLGKVWVASFVFTQCTTSCPQVTLTMHRLQSELGLTNQPDLRLVTFSMDPEDTPDILKKYASAPDRPADKDRWLFLSSPSEDIQKLMKDGFKLAFESNPPTANSRDKYSHGTFLFVVDKKGLIRGNFDGLQGKGDPTGERYRESVARLSAKVRELLAE
jgi:protein SCO1/2